MHHKRCILGMILFIGTLTFPFAASAVLVDSVGLEVRARIDTDGLKPNAPIVNLTESEIDRPYDRSVVSLSGEVSGFYRYGAVSDIGNQVLKVNGSLTNNTAVDMFGQGVPLINVYAQAKDLLTLSAGVAGTFPVTLELVVHGTLVTTPTEGQVIANSSLTFGPVVGLDTTDANLYKTAESIEDTLRVTRNVTFAAPGATVDMEFDTFISFTAFYVPANTTVSGDLSNTAFLNLVLPAEVSLTSSGSGTFGVPIPVPEPQTYALMLLGLALVGARALRSHARSIRGLR
jgi:hypothetical protein